MITGAHFLLYSVDADADRRFLRDTFGFPAVDAGGGWLIFRLPPAELAVHPAAANFVQQERAFDVMGCALYLMCDDIEKTLADVTAKGAEISSPVSDQGWGLLTALALPGGVELGLYQPRHPTAV